jgi:two-component system, OmpR family, response regulator
MRILVVEDDRKVASFIRKGLEEEGHAVEVASDGAEAIERVADGSPWDLVVLDVMLPKRDGFSVLKTLREDGLTAPVLMLTARDAVGDRVTGLDLGADDYLTKPFAFSELLARIEALLRRRSTPAVQTKLTVGDLEMDLLTRQVKRAGQSIELQPREFRLLEYLMRHAGQVVTRTMLLEGVWDYHFDPQTNVIDVHISRLRQKIDKGFQLPLLHTVRGAGYCIRADN